MKMNEIKMENDNLSTDIETRKERENKWEEERRKMNVNNTKIKLLHEEHLHKNSMAMKTMTLKLKEEEEKHCIEKNAFLLQQTEEKKKHVDAIQNWKKKDDLKLDKLNILEIELEKEKGRFINLLIYKP